MGPGVRRDDIRWVGNMPAVPRPPARVNQLFTVRTTVNPQGDAFARCAQGGGLFFAESGPAMLLIRGQPAALPEGEDAAGKTVWSFAPQVCVLVAGRAGQDALAPAKLGTPAFSGD